MPLKLSALVAAAEQADWQQVVLNGGPPCFHYESDRERFCLRAKRWAGHNVDHHFVSLAGLLWHSFPEGGSTMAKGRKKAFGGKKAAPFGKGGKRQPFAERTATGRKRKRAKG
jgi:hypothetical protein